MRKLWPVSCFASFMAHAALAQTPPPAPPPMKLFTAAAEIPALIAKAKAEYKDGQPMTPIPILSLAPYRAVLEYRPKNFPPALHEKDAEMIYVLEGTGTFVSGGKLVDEKRANATNLSGTAITGGQQQAIAKGDFIFVPENTPHQTVVVDGAPIILMSIHVPRPTQWP